MAVFPYPALLGFAREIFTAADLSPERADTMARVLIEADLMGFPTHGLNRVASNVEWLLSGETRREGEPRVMVDRGALLHWDAMGLPGPYVVSRAVDLACERAVSHGQATIVIRDAQHIACLAAYLLPAVERGLVIQMLCASPGDRNVSAFGGIEPIFSPNPFAFAAPTSGDPILVDMSLSIVAEGQVAMARREGRLLPFDALKDADGNPSRDPADYWDAPRGTLMPIGGMTHGYKGFGLCLWSEIMTLALANYGRADQLAYTEANSVFIQVLDPAAFGSLAGFVRESDYLAALCANSRHAPGEPPVRVPGARALQLRRRQLQEGVELSEAIVGDLGRVASELGVDNPLG